jgi:uncharacterized protein YjcR
MNFLTDADLAEKLGEPEAKVVEWRRRYGWPHLKIGRQVRYTEADVRAIEALHHVGTAKSETLPGQTALSAARSR